MNVEEFNKHLNHRIKLIRQVLDSKNKEYASDVDKLHNFKRAGDMLRQTPEKALIGMWSKHIISILDIVDKIELDNQSVGLIFTAHPNSITIDMIEEKIGDAINYLILLEALLKERYNDE